MQVQSSPTLELLASARPRFGARIMHALKRACMRGEDDTARERNAHVIVQTGGQVTHIRCMSCEGALWCSSHDFAGFLTKRKGKLKLRRDSRSAVLLRLFEEKAALRKADVEFWWK